MAEMWGLTDVAKRVKTLESRAAKKRKDAKYAVIKGERQAKIALSKASQLDALANELQDLHVSINDEAKELTAKGKKELDGRRATAIRNRKLNYLCGVVEADTTLVCVGDHVSTETAYWADAWIVDILNALSKCTPATVMQTFYNDMVTHKNDPDRIESIAGMLILKYKEIH